jgi:uncharacterized protein (DUF2141 family)
MPAGRRQLRFHEEQNMRKIALIAATIAFLGALPAPANAQADAQNATGKSSLTIEVSKLRNDQGAIQAYLFLESNKKGKAGYPSEDSCDRVLTVPIVNGEATIVFEGIPSGYCAFYLHHDENNDGKMNSNFIGMPTEGYAFSNNAKPGLTGIPKFNASRILIDVSAKTVQASMLY